MKYLSLDWIDALTDEVENSRELAEMSRTYSIAVTQVVTDTPEGDVTYHLVVGDGAARFGTGPADAEDVRMVQTYESAVAVATGAINAQDVFINGHIKVSGDVQKLIENEPIFAALNSVFEKVRQQTDYS